MTLLARPIDRTALAHHALGGRDQNTLMPLATGKTETRYEGRTVSVGILSSLTENTLHFTVFVVKESTMATMTILHLVGSAVYACLLPTY